LYTIKVKIGGKLKKQSNQKNNDNIFSRRDFFKIGGLAAAGSTLTMCSFRSKEEKAGKIKNYRKLGRTGFKVSDIALGGAANDPKVVRYAYDQGINYFDTAESYSGGASEKAIGDAMEFMNRKKIWITTKIHFKPEETEQNLLDRFTKCQERLNTEYVDALFIHGVESVDILNHKDFHAVVKKLKADGRLKHAGISCHGPQGSEGDSFEKIITTAAEDGRFDLMLLSYNFMNKDDAEKVLKVCNKNNIGTTAMKTCPGVITVDPVDPENLTKEYQEAVESMVKRGLSRSDAIQRLERYVERQKKTIEQTKPFADKHGIKTNKELRKACCQWVLQNPDMHTACLSLETFDDIDEFIGLSGTKLNVAYNSMLKDYEKVFSNLYCRHGCSSCLDKCSKGLPISTIMRYSYYFKTHGWEKYAIQKYAALEDKNGLYCLDCDAPCANSCPYELDIQSNMVYSHSLLSLG